MGEPLAQNGSRAHSNGHIFEYGEVRILVG